MRFVCLVVLLVAACNSADETDEGLACGPGGMCPSGYLCGVRTNRCQRGSATADAAVDARGAADAAAAVDAGESPDAAVAATPDAAPMVDAPPALLELAPASQDFGAVVLGTSSGAFTVSVINAGGMTTGALALSVSDPASYSVGGDCAGRTLAPGATCEVTLTFHPSGAAGPRPATLSVTASPGGGASSTLAGSALTPGALTLAPSAANFERSLLGDRRELSFTVTNTGQTPTGTLAPALSPTPHFSVTSSDCPATLAAGATCTLVVGFQPTSVGVKQGVSLTVAATPGGTAVSSLRGIGAAQLLVSHAGGGTVTSSPAGIQCGADCAATFTTSTVTLTATPDATHTFAGWQGCTGDASCRVTLDAASQSVTASFAVIAMADLRVVGSASPSSVANGQEVVTTFAVTNLGPSAATGVAASLDVPAGTTLLSASSSKGTCSTVSGTIGCAVGALQAAEVATITARLRATAAGTFTQSATVSALEVDPVSTNDGASVTVPVATTGDLAITSMTASPNPGFVGGLATYAIVARNAGPDAASGARLTVTLGPSVAFVSATTGVGSCGNVSGTITCDLGSLASGGVANVSIVGRTTAAGTISSSASISSAAADPTTSNNAATASATVNLVNVVFVSSQTYPADLGSATAYDAECNELAAAAGINNAAADAFVAWVSDDNSDVRDRLGSARGFVRTDGAPVADDLASWTTGGKMFHAIDRDENGDVFPEAFPQAWTGQTWNGEAPSELNCENWTSTSSQGTVGAIGWGPNWWGGGREWPCDAPQHIYCLMKTRAAPVTVTPTAGKKIYVNMFTLGGGLAAANAACAAVKPSGTGFTAALLPLFGPPARPASALLSPTATYVRPDGVVVGTGAEIAAGRLKSGIWQLANGSYRDGRLVFNGTERVTDTPTSADSTCGDYRWTSGGSPISGYPQSATAEFWWGSNATGYTCEGLAQPSRFYCVEQ